ncbi:MAG TPA: hypothetical protein VHK27_11870, partial [Gammaproteobacteria bacterium]|nr:hypothetical protein [Gammaproteobacteria bacterium]
SVISWTGFQYIPGPAKPETKKGSCYVLAKVILAPRTLQNGEAGHSRDYLFDGMVPEKTGITEPEFESNQDSESRGTDSWPACLGEGCSWCSPSGQAEPEFGGLVI